MSAIPTITVRHVLPGEEHAVSALVVATFRHDVAALYSQEGVHEFLRYASPDGIRERHHRGHFTLVAIEGKAVLGTIEIRTHSHVSLFFVDPGRQRDGIGRCLLAEALRLCRAQPACPAEITVNSSPNAVDAYRRFGFRPTAGLQVKNGIKFVPMAMPLGQPDGA